MSTHRQNSPKLNYATSKFNVQDNTYTTKRKVRD